MYIEWNIISHKREWNQSLCFCFPEFLPQLKFFPSHSVPGEFNSPVSIIIMHDPLPLAAPLVSWMEGATSSWHVYCTSIDSPLTFPFPLFCLMTLPSTHLFILKTSIIFSPFLCCLLLLHTHEIRHQVWSLLAVECSGILGFCMNLLVCLRPKSLHFQFILHEVLNCSSRTKI